MTQHKNIIGNALARFIYKQSCTKQLLTNFATIDTKQLFEARATKEGFVVSNKAANANAVAGMLKDLLDTCFMGKLQVSDIDFVQMENEIVEVHPFVNILKERLSEYIVPIEAAKTLPVLADFNKGASTMVKETYLYAIKQYNNNASRLASILDKYSKKTLPKKRGAKKATPLHLDEETTQSINTIITDGNRIGTSKVEICRNIIQHLTSHGITPPKYKQIKPLFSWFTNVDDDTYNRAHRQIRDESAKKTHEKFK